MASPLPQLHLARPAPLLSEPRRQPPQRLQSPRIAVAFLRWPRGARVTQLAAALRPILPKLQASLPASGLRAGRPQRRRLQQFPPGEYPAALPPAEDARDREVPSA